MTTSLEYNLGRFNVLLGESIDETITALLGQEVVDGLYVYLQKVHSTSKDEVPHKLEALCSTLEKIFGPPGSRTIYKAIARRLFDKLGLTFINNPSLTLLEYVEEAKMKVREKGGQA